MAATKFVELRSQVAVAAMGAMMKRAPMCLFLIPKFRSGMIEEGEDPELLYLTLDGDGYPCYELRTKWPETQPGVDHTEFLASLLEAVAQEMRAHAPREDQDGAGPISPS